MHISRQWNASLQYEKISNDTGWVWYFTVAVGLIHVIVVGVGVVEQASKNITIEYWYLYSVTAVENFGIWVFPQKKISSFTDIVYTPSTNYFLLHL
jgi:hypothetical protein